MKWLFRALASLFLAALIAFGFRLWNARRLHGAEHDHDAPFGLHADLIERKVSYGIPGVSKTYEAALSNLGYLPAWVTACDYVDDTFSRGTMIGYTLERQNRTTGEWETTVDMNGPDYC